MIDFLQHLFEDGELTVPREASESPETVDRLLIIAERIWRDEFPCTPPPFDVRIANQAAQVVCIMSQAVVYRELDEHVIQQRLDVVGLVPKNSCSKVYSADLTLRFLPQIVQRLLRISTADPIHSLMLQLGRDWPLSSIGMMGVAPNALPSSIQHRGLFRLYVDRVLACSDNERMNIKSVADAVNAAVGPFPDSRAISGLKLD